MNKIICFFWGHSWLIRYRPHDLLTPYKPYVGHKCERCGKISHPLGYGIIWPKPPPRACHE